MTVPDEFPPPGYAVPQPRARVASVTLVVFLLAAFSAAAWFGREALLRGAAELWIVSDTVGPADAVAIFGGGLAVRPFAAAEYYRKGLVKKILIPNVRLDKSETLGGLPSHTIFTRSMLVNLGVPETAIEIFGNGLSNTYEEAVALREWAIRTRARNIIVPTQIFSVRRVRWVVERELAGTGVKVQVPALDDPEYTPADWWRNEKAIIEFQNEVLKYVYYRFKY